MRYYKIVNRDTKKPFHYKNWNVIGPIAEKHNCFPTRNKFGSWTLLSGTADTPQKAIALAVIGGVK